jgi:hypothetical protein
VVFFIITAVKFMLPASADDLHDSTLSTPAALSAPATLFSSAQLT